MPMISENSFKWEEVYNSLNINEIKQKGILMLKAILVVGVFMVVASLLVFSHQPEIGLFLTLALLFITIRLYWSVVKLNKRPKVVVGPIVKRSTLSYRNSKTHTRTIRHFLSINANDAFEIDHLGKADYLPLSNKPKKYECSSSLYNSVIEGESIVAVIFPHNNSIAQIL